MNGKEFKEELKNPKNIYCLVSTDSAMVDLYVNRFKTAIGATNVSYGKIKPYGKLFKQKTLNVLYVPKLEEDIFDRREFIFIYTDSVDKRLAVYKQHKDRFIELNNDYTDYIMKNSNMTEEQAKKFIIANKNDFGLITNNLKLYKDSGYTYNRFTDYSSDSIAWVNAFIKKEPLPKCNESPISVMALLSVNCQNILNVKRNNTKDMNPYIVQCVRPLVNYMTEEELAQIIGDCFYYDCMIKKDLINIDYVLKCLKLRRYSDATTN